MNKAFLATLFSMCNGLQEKPEEDILGGLCNTTITQRLRAEKRKRSSSTDGPLPPPPPTSTLILCIYQ